MLRVFDVLLEERSVTRAGARLGLTQSAVSHALSRLRHGLGDELFVRGPDGMRPTPRALEIGAQVHAAIHQLQTALSTTDFDPAKSERRFTIAAGTYASAVIAPSLVARLAAEAPLTELALSDYAPAVIDALDARQADFVIGGVVAAPERFARETLLVEELAWVVNVDSPLARRPVVDLAALAATPHVVISRRPPGQADEAAVRRGVLTRPSWEDAGALEAALAAEGLRRRVGVTVSDTYAALAIAARSEMAALVPRRLARLSAARGTLKLIEPPYASPPVEVGLMFLRERLAEPPIAWMRDVLREVARGIA
ncbi:LysR family transcriptional regulator [Phenylobacterium sp.]|uniref:LysR family transcriptional regulator n=1 Tax=Phenylobacterium sp. TaxID=1871053 RepID=UPI0025E44173|nr:LysR family transcriptional regulator [Phenylobacterium sp.]